MVGTNGIEQLQSTSKQSFLYFSGEVLSVLENWLMSAKTENSFQRLNELMLKDRILTAVPDKMAVFLK